MAKILAIVLYSVFAQIGIWFGLIGAGHTSVYLANGGFIGSGRSAWRQRLGIIRANCSLQAE